jgi:prepilin-type N-terminal cleavage/methylation domain-containing protein
VHTLRARRGFTLIEMMIAMALMLAVIGLSTRLFRSQSNAVSTQAGRLDAQQNSRFAIGNLDRELRMAGGGVVNQQPLLVMAGATALTFNADLVALDTGDLAAVYINPDADSGAVGVLRSTNKITLPGTSNLYPDTTYMQNGGIPSNAETISYWLSRDSTSTRTNEYILFRRANARPPRVVARGIIYNSGDTIFRYFKGDTSGTLTPVSPALLPLVHSAPVHGTQADTGKSALTDSIRQVRVQFTSVFHDPRTNQDIMRKMQTTIRLMNSGLIQHSTCGNAPLGVAPTATVIPANGTTVLQTYVRLSWTPSIDEATGEKDVERYAIYRRLSSVSTFDQPFASVAAGGVSTYTFNDSDVVTGQTWIYGVTALDCTPLASSAGSTTAVVIP